MEQEQASRFLHTARNDYTDAVEHYMHWVNDARGADEAVHLARLRLLAAKQVLTVAQDEARQAQDRAHERDRPQGRICAQCGSVGLVHETAVGGDLWLCHGCWERKQVGRQGEW